MNASTSIYRDPKDLVQPAVKANKEHQYALKVYTERLEAELKQLDKLLAAAEVSDNEEDEVQVVRTGGTVSIPGTVKPSGLIPASELLDENSPFHHDAMRRQTYEEFTTSHPMKAQELEALADAVRSENYRLYALQAQARGLPPFLGMGDQPDFSQNKEGIDWERVAQKVSSASATVQRTARECEIRWLGERHPQFSDAQWTQSEITQLRQLVGIPKEGEVNWVEIAEKLGTGRTPVDCMRHAIVRRAHTWSPEADDRLLEAVEIYGTDSWWLVARMVSEDATAAQCQNRYTRTLDPSLRRGPWTPEEDELLRRSVSVLGKVWIDVAQFVPGRNSEQCRERYQEKLNPSLSKGKWTAEEDASLLEIVAQVGEGKWKEISRTLNIGRTDNMCRMRYAVLVKKKPAPSPQTPVPESQPVGSPAPAQSAPSRVSTPADQGPILILHPETYRPSSSSTASPAQTPGPPSSASTTPVPRPKPKPKPRRKQPAASESTADASAAERAIAPPGAEALPGLTPHLTPEGSARAGSSSGSNGTKRVVSAADSRPNKCQRTTPSSVIDTESHRQEPIPSDETPMEVDEYPESGRADASLTEPDPIPGVSAKSRGRGRGRGRGKGAGSARGRGRPRGRPPGRKSVSRSEVQDDETILEAGPSTLPQSPQPTRRQPRRAATKSRPLVMDQDDIDGDGI